MDCLYFLRTKTWNALWRLMKHKLALAVILCSTFIKVGTRAIWLLSKIQERAQYRTLCLTST